MPNSLVTDWKTIGRSGPTVDGRFIKPEWLTQAAQIYDPEEEYSAVINAEHSYGNYGDVVKLRTTLDSKERVCLQATLCPNQYYLYMNSAKQLRYFSMELTHNFAKTGKTYLTGLAITDKPASLGTSQANFSAQDDEKVFRGGDVEMFTTDLIPSNNDSKSIAAAVVDGIKNLFKNNNTNEQEEDYEMNEEQFNQMLDGQNKVVTALEALTGVVTNLSTKPDKDGKDGKDGDGKGDDDKEKETDKTNAAAGDVNAEVFKQFSDGQTKLNDSIMALTSKLETALNGKFGKDTSNGTGPETDNDVDVL